MIKAFVFDLDGTIINTLESLTYSVNESIGQFGCKPLDAEHTRQYIGNGARKLIQRAMEFSGKCSEEMLEQAMPVYKETFSANCTRGNKAYDGMRETLEELKKRGMKLAVTSNKSQNGVEACIRNVYGEGLFDVLRGEREGVPLKPDPSVILDTLKEMNVRPEECVYVGDGDTDMQAGRAAGCVTVAVTWGYRPREILESFHPDHLIDTPEKLLMIK